MKDWRKLLKLLHVKDHKKLNASFALTLFLLVVTWYLVTNIFFSNYYENWKEEPYSVLEVYDGDTILVSGRFNSFKVRYIGMDTPETEKPNQPLECFANEAKKRNQDLLASANNKVYLESDTENKDKYDRELRYVYIKHEDQLYMVNYILVQEGYASAMKIEPNVKNADEIKSMESLAKVEKKGMWGRCK